MDKELITKFTIDDGIILRSVADDDAERVLEAVLRNYDHLRPFMHWMTPDYSMESVREFIVNSHRMIKERLGQGFCIFRGEAFIGSIGFTHFDWIARKTEIGYWIDQGEGGKGIVTKACERLIRYAFDDLGMNRIEIRCSSENLRSAAVPERLGFQKEGTLRQSELRNGRFHDFSIYGLLAQDRSVC